MIGVDEVTTGYNIFSAVARDQSEPTASELIGRLLNNWHIIQSIGVVEMLTRVSESTGGYIKLVREYAYFPVLIGSDNKPVPLFKFVEVIDEKIDYDEIREAFPNLSYSQIDGALSFLKKVSQFNSGGIDIDDIEDERDAEDADLLRDLNDGLSNKEIARVLHQHQ